MEIREARTSGSPPAEAEANPYQGPGMLSNDPARKAPAKRLRHPLRPGRKLRAPGLMEAAPAASGRPMSPPHRS